MFILVSYRPKSITRYFLLHELIPSCSAERLIDSYISMRKTNKWTWFDCFFFFFVLFSLFCFGFFSSLFPVCFVFVFPLFLFFFSCSFFLFFLLLFEFLFSFFCFFFSLFNIFFLFPN